MNVPIKQTESFCVHPKRMRSVHSKVGFLSLLQSESVLATAVPYFESGSHLAMPSTDAMKLNHFTKRDQQEGEEMVLAKKKKDS